jgi:hypothetical protein
MVRVMTNANVLDHGINPNRIDMIYTKAQRMRYVVPDPAPMIMTS